MIKNKAYKPKFEFKNFLKLGHIICFSKSSIYGEFKTAIYFK